MNSESETPSEKRRFLPAYGRAALMLPVVGIVGSAVGSRVLDGLESSLLAGDPSGEDAAVVFYLRILLFGLTVLAGGAGFVLGLLSLLGKGKVDGSSHRFAGFFGMLLGGAVACMPLVLLPAVDAAKNAKFQAQVMSMDSGAQQLRTAEGAVVLNRPSERWAIFDGEKARTFNPLASVVAMKAVDNEKVAVGIIIAEPAEPMQLGVENEDQIQDLLPVMAKNLVQQAAFQDKSEARFRPCVSTPAEGQEVMYEATTPEGERLAVRQQLYRWRGHIIQLAVTIPVEASEDQKAFAETFFRAVSLVE